MHFWKKRLQRAAALFCTLALCAGMVPSAAFAQEPSTAAQVSLTQQGDSQGAPEGETTPPESTPAQSATEPEQGATEPEQGATEPEQGATEPEQGATEPEQGATEPEQGATEPEQGATEPEQGATEPEQGATEPEQGATVPEEGATVPGAAALQAPAANAADARAEADVSVQVQFAGNGLEDGTVKPGTAFNLPIAFANSTENPVTISIPLQVSGSHLNISGLRDDNTLTVGSDGVEITLTYNPDTHTFTGTLPAGCSSTGTITMLFDKGLTPTGESVTVNTPTITSGYDGSNTRLEAFGTTTVNTKTDAIDWKTTSGGYPQYFPVVGSPSSGDLYIQFQTGLQKVAGDGASYTETLTVTQTIEFVGFEITGLNEQNVANHISDNYGGGTFSDVSPSGYTITWVLNRDEDSAEDIELDRVNTLDTGFSLTSCTATEGDQSIRMESNVTATPVLNGYNETSLDDNQSTRNVPSRAATSVTVKAYGEQACETEKLVFTAGETIYYKVTYSVNGNEGTYRFQRREFDDLDNQFDNTQVVSYKVNGEEQSSLPTSTYQFQADLQGGTNTVEVVYAFTLKTPPTGLASGDKIDGGFAVMNSLGSTLSTASQSVAYVVTESTSSDLGLRKTAKNSESGDTLVYTLTVTNETENRITATVYDSNWPCEVFVLTDVQAPDGAIVEYEFADGSKTLEMPGEDAQPADEKTGLTKITVYNVPVDAQSETLVYLTAKEREGINTPFTVANNAGLPGGSGVVCNLVLSCPLTKNVYWDEDCQDEITATETVNAGDTVYYKITLANHGENTESTWFTLHDALPEGLTLERATRDGEVVTARTENGEAVFPAIQLEEGASTSWVLQCTVTQGAIEAAQAAHTANLTNTAYVAVSADGTEYAQTPDAVCEVTIAGMEQGTLTITKTLEAVYRDMNVIAQNAAENSTTLNPYPYNLGKTQTALGPGNYAAYGVRVSNAQGSNPVPVYQVKDVLPDGMAYVGLITPNDGQGRGFVINRSLDKDQEVRAGRGHATHNQGLKATLTTSSTPGTTGTIVWDVTPFNGEGTHYIQPGESIAFYVLVKVDSMPADGSYLNTAAAKTATWVQPGADTTVDGVEEDGKWLKSTLNTPAGTFKPSILKAATAKKAGESASEATDTLPVVGQSDWVKYRVTVSTADNAPFLSNFYLVDTLPDGYSYVDGTAIFATDDQMIDHRTQLTAEVDGQTLTLTFPEGDTTGILGLGAVRTTYVEYWVKPTSGTQTNASSENTVTAVFDHAFSEAGTCTSYDLEERSVTSKAMTYALGDMAMLPQKSMKVNGTEYGLGSGIASVTKGQQIEYSLNGTSYLSSSYTLSNLSLTDTLPYLGDSRDSGVKVDVDQNAAVTVQVNGQAVDQSDYEVTITSNRELQQPSTIKIDFSQNFVDTYAEALRNNGKFTVTFPATVVGGSSNIAGINDFVLNYHATPQGGETFELAVASNQVAVMIPGISTDTEGADTSLWVDKSAVAATGSTLPALTDGMFTFTISAQNGAPLPENTTASYRASDGKAIFDPISYEKAGSYVYTIRETTPGDGWTNTTGAVTATVQVSQDAATGKLKIDSITYTGGGGDKHNQITNEYADTKINVSVQKVWDDSNNTAGFRPGSVTVQLLANGAETDKTVTLNESNNWTATFGELNKDSGGKPIEYTVKEVLEGDAASKYTVAITGDADTGFTITNKYTPETVSVEGAKTWDDNGNADGNRPASITINLLANGVKKDTKTVTEKEGWKWSFTDLPKYANGEEITYSITEDTVPNYTSEVNGYDVTNTYAPGKTQVTVTKVWDDSNNTAGFRPGSVTVQLLANGAETDKTVTLNESNNWTATFGELNKDSGGKPIEYTVKEVLEGDAASKYTVAITGDADTGFTITNKYTPETVSVEGAKTWDDNGNADGNRPASITINLLANGVKKDTKTVTEKEGWKWSFTDLPKYANGEEITYSITEDTVPNYTSEVNGYDVTNTYAPGKTQVTVTKVWDDSNNTAGFRPGSVTVQLLANGAETDKTVTLNESNNWTATFGELNKDSGGKPIEYTVKEVLEGDAASKYTVAITGDADTGFTITNKYTPETVDIPVEKVWVDENNKYNNRPGQIIVTLQKGGSDTTNTLTLNEANHWKGTFADLPKYEDGAAIQYTVKEVPVPGYESNVKPDGKGGFTITNTLETTDIEGTKTWNDANNQDGKRPAQITINLMVGTDIVETKIVEGAGNTNTWDWSFTDLPVYRGGQKVTYTVQEVPVDNYGTTYGDNYSITNTYTPGKTSVSVTKSWQDSNDQDGKRPDEITVRLYADNEETNQTLKLNAGNNWYGSFIELDEYKNGKEIAYTVKEEGTLPNGYTSQVTSTGTNQFTITNSYTPKTTEVTVTKKWEDNNNQDGVRPTSITVQLLADGETWDTATITPDAAGNWTTYTFKDLPVYKNHGTPIEYSVQETQVDGYDEPSIKGDAEQGFTITNSRTPETTEVTVTKEWADDNNRDGKRPDEITVQLQKKVDGEWKDVYGQTATITPDKDGNWTHTFENLPKNENGKLIEYSVKEVLDEATDELYTSELSGSMAEGFIITNTYKPETIDLEGSKTWDDANNQDGIRPESITVHLYADDAEEPVQTLEVKPDDSGNWNWKFEKLHKYRDGGTAIQYTVVEEAVEGYDAKVDYNKADGSHTLTNTHTPEEIDIPVTKKWADANDQDGKRPDAVTVRLYADGKALEGMTATLNADNGWKHTFEGLPKYRDGGIEIVYTITEDAVPGYTTAVDNETFTVTNHYTPGKTSVSVTKNWDDNGNQDGMRPAVIEIKLLADGADTGKTLRLSAENAWSGTFGNLDEYKAGEKIRYSVQEVGVHGYESSISGDAVEGYVVTNRHVPERVEVSGRKIWRDASNQSLRPDCITIRLLANERAIAKVLVTAEDDWQWTFTDLPKYENGKQIVYSISEDKVEGYTTTIDGYNVINTSEWEGLTGLPAGTIPQTGDDMPVGLLAGLAAAAAAGLAALLALRKRRSGK